MSEKYKRTEVRFVLRYKGDPTTVWYPYDSEFYTKDEAITQAGHHNQEHEKHPLIVVLRKVIEEEIEQ